jgi:hypothetical protein
MKHFQGFAGRLDTVEMRLLVWEHSGFVWPLGCPAADRPKTQDRKPQQETQDSETRANWALCRIPAQSRSIFDALTSASGQTFYPEFLTKIEQIAVIRSRKRPLSRA